MAALALGYEDPYDLTDADLATGEGSACDLSRGHRSSRSIRMSRSSSICSRAVTSSRASATRATTWVSPSREPPSRSLPPEGALTWTCGYSLGANAENLDGAYSLLEWFLTPEAQAVYATKLNQMATNEATLDALPQSVVEEIGLGRPGATR